MEESRKRYGDDDERIRRKLDRERFTLPPVEFKDRKGKVTDRFERLEAELAEVRAQMKQYLRELGV